MYSPAVLTSMHGPDVPNWHPAHIIHVAAVRGESVRVGVCVCVERETETERETEREREIKTPTHVHS